MITNERKWVYRHIYHRFSPVAFIHCETLEVALALGVHEGLRQLICDVFGPEANILTQRVTEHIIIPGLCENHLNY